MKQILILFSLIFFPLSIFAQPKTDPRLTNPKGETERAVLWGGDAFTIENHRRTVELSPCKPTRGIDYTENTRKPLDPFIFQKLHFETSYGYYTRITLDIEAKGNTIVNIQDDYYAQTTTIRSDIGRNDFTNLLFILARCDYDSFRDIPVNDDMKCCSSFIEIGYNNEIKRSRGCAFVPFNYRELEDTLWSYIVLKASHALDAPQTEY
jgi:hypothetical protein